MATRLELPPKPINLKQAQQHQYLSEWLLAKAEEYKSHNNNGTWDNIIILPAGYYALPTKWVYKYKLRNNGIVKRYKARLVVCGNRQNVNLWRNTYAAVARATTIKVLLALVAALNLECKQANVITAFLNSLIDNNKEVYIRLPDS